GVGWGGGEGAGGGRGEPQAHTTYRSIFLPQLSYLLDTAQLRVFRSSGGGATHGTRGSRYGSCVPQSTELTGANEARIPDVSPRLASGIARQSYLRSQWMFMLPDT